MTLRSGLSTIQLSTGCASTTPEGSHMWFTFKDDTLTCAAAGSHAAVNKNNNSRFI